MRLLLDSHAFLWWSEASSALSPTARNAIADPANETLISIAGLWELIIKASLGKLALPDDLETMAISQGFSVLSISFTHLRRFAALPWHHKDPFDRMMIAQSLAEGIPIATADRRFAAYGVQIVWWRRSATAPRPGRKQQDRVVEIERDRARQIGHRMVSSP